MRKTKARILLSILLIAAFMFGGCATTNIRMAQPAIVEVSKSLRIINGVAYMNLITQKILWPHAKVFHRDVEYILAMDIKEVDLTINSPGGGIIAMWAMYDKLRTMKASGVKLTTHAEGEVASAAVPLFLLGDVRTMSKNTFFMIHAHSGLVTPWKSDTENEIYRSWSKTMIEIIANRTNMTKEEVEKHVGQGKTDRKDSLYLNFKLATEKGFITK